MARVSKLTRRCEHCDRAPRGRNTLRCVLTTYRNVYTYRWLCVRCRSRKHDEAHA
jgi:hypothetical protein